MSTRKKTHRTLRSLQVGVVPLNELLDKNRRETSLFMHIEVASGETDGKKFRVISVIPDGSLIVEIKDGRTDRVLKCTRYMVNIHDVINAAADVWRATRRTA